MEFAALRELVPATPATIEAAEEALARGDADEALALARWLGNDSGRFRRDLVEASALEATAQPQVAHLRCHGGEIDHDQVVGDAEYREAIRRVAYAAASQNGLVIAGDDAAVASLG